MIAQKINFSLDLINLGYMQPVSLNGIITIFIDAVHG